MDEAKALGARNLAMELYAPLFLMIQLYDGGADRDELHDRLNKIIGAYEKRYKVYDRQIHLPESSYVM